MITINIAEVNFRWNAIIRMNLLIYQQFSLGLFLNLIKGFDSRQKPILKVSYLLCFVGLLILLGNGYLLYEIVEKHYRMNKDKIIEEERLEKQREEQAKLNGLNPLMGLGFNR